MMRASSSPSGVSQRSRSVPHLRTTSSTCAGCSVSLHPRETIPRASATAWGDCQLRTAKGQTRHLYLVMLAHSLLIAQMGQGRACGWAHSVLTTIGQACRAVSRETLSKTIHWAVEQATTLEWNQQRIVTCLPIGDMRPSKSAESRDSHSPNQSRRPPSGRSCTPSSSSSATMAGSHRLSGAIRLSIQRYSCSKPNRVRIPLSYRLRSVQHL